MNPQIEEELRSCEATIASKRKLRRMFKSEEYATLVDNVAALEKKFYVFSNGKISIYCETPGFTVEAGPELFSILEFLEDILGPGKSLDFPNDSQRVYYWPVTIRGFETEVCLTATLTEGSELCHRIVVGETEDYEYVKVAIKKPTFKFVC